MLQLGPPRALLPGRPRIQPIGAPWRVLGVVRAQAGAGRRGALVVGGGAVQRRASLAAGGLALDTAERGRASGERETRAQGPAGVPPPSYRWSPGAAEAEGRDPRLPLR